jgi:hypothetical protein
MNEVKNERNELSSSDWFSRVYDVLVKYADAPECDKDSFIYHHAQSEYGCREWRFCGSLGFGGKYRSGRNTIDCYREDETPERLKIIEGVNRELSLLNNDVARSEQITKE